MHSISMNMLFWDDGLENKTRFRNVKFTWDKLKELSLYLNNAGLKTTAKLFDFSESQLIEESIHSPYPTGTYQLSKKINQCLVESDGADFFMKFDCDTFFDTEDYEPLKNILLALESGDIITFDLAKLDGDPSNYIKDSIFDKSKADWSYAYSGNRKLGPLHHCSGGLGGVFLIDSGLLNGIDGFDEKFKGWGGEDGDALNRVLISKMHSKLLPTNKFAPFHLPHDVDSQSPLYSERF